MLFYSSSSQKTAFQAVLAPFLQDDGLPFADVLSAQDIQDACDAEDVSFGRLARSIFTPALVIWTFLSQVLGKDKSCRAAVLRVMVLLLGLECGRCSPDTAAYCRARGKMPAAVFRRLARQVGERMEAAVPSRWLWQGQHCLFGGRRHAVVARYAGEPKSLSPTTRSETRFRFPFDAHGGIAVVGHGVVA